MLPIIMIILFFGSMYYCIAALQKYSMEQRMKDKFGK